MKQTNTIENNKLESVIITIYKLFAKDITSL